jgi:hypothetical protein
MSQYTDQARKILKSRGASVSPMALRQESFEVAVKARILETDALVYDRYGETKMARRAAREARMLRAQSHALKLASRLLKLEAENV